MVALLISRGMLITDKPKAELCLSRIGYYRLSAYWYPFRESKTETDPTTGGKRVVVMDNFKPDTKFTTVHDLYVFDKKLRLIVLDALERIEITVRTDIATLLGIHGRLAHRDPKILHGNFARRAKAPGSPKTKLDTWLDRLDKKFDDSREDFAKHFKRKYPNDHLPIWMAVELWDFGTLSHFISGLTVKDKDALALTYGIPNGIMLESWIRCLNDIRNICAHHSRLWNRPLVSQPRWPSANAIAYLDHLQGDTHGQTRLYAALVLLCFMLKKVNPTSTWAKRLSDHVATLPDNPYVTVHNAGFPVNWMTQPIWS